MDLLALVVILGLAGGYIWAHLDVRSPAAGWLVVAVVVVGAVVLSKVAT